ncbi:hypothetical protein ElyMa_006139900 [Elysia marginata]|uniref:Uncharacterized protein n=1 Tax=Elysia marginata TaxID=1093978 RepID=A0AAV4GVV0_9GAST|nr:hypothetical protein ElyMa_006139900 [Elysia marginata]
MRVRIPGTTRNPTPAWMVSTSSGAMPAGVGDQGPPTNSTAHLSDHLGWFLNIHPARQAVQHLFSWSSSASLFIKFSCCHQINVL